MLTRHWGPKTSWGEGDVCDTNEWLALLLCNYHQGKLVCNLGLQLVIDAAVCCSVFGIHRLFKRTVAGSGREILMSFCLRFLL